jgi:hypothetical protein
MTLGIGQADTRLFHVARVRVHVGILVVSIALDTGQNGESLRVFFHGIVFASRHVGRKRRPVRQRNVLRAGIGCHGLDDLDLRVQDHDGRRRRHKGSLKRHSRKVNGHGS